MRKCHINTNHFPLSIPLGFFLFSLLSIPPSYVYSKSSAEQQKEGQEEQVEKITIIGSRIKRVHVEGAIPRTIIEREELERTGYNSLGDILRNLTINSFGSRRESARSSSPGVAAVNLKGLGPDRTLVLINGKRVQKDPITHFVDLNLIPLASIERVEIVQDGASSLYGSEALGGVVNIVTRKGFHGNEVSAKYSLSEGRGGDQSEISLASGYETSKLSVTSIIYHRSNEEILSSDRKHSRLQMSSYSSHGTFRFLKSDKQTPYMGKGNDFVYTKSDCPQVVATRGGSGCRENYAEYITNRPSLSQTSALLDTKLKIRDGLSVFLQANGTKRRANWHYAPTAVGPFSEHGLSGKSAKKYIDEADPSLKPILMTLQDDDFVGVSYRFVGLDNLESDIQTDQYGAVTGLDVELSEAWSLEAFSGYSNSLRRDRGVKGHVLSQDIQYQLDNNFNPFASSVNRESLTVKDYQAWMHSQADVLWSEVIVRGEVLEMASGPVGIAFGGTFQKESFRVDSDEALKNEEVVGRAGGESKGERDIFSTYVELSLPLSPVFEWSLSGRHDSYSDFGHIFSPQTAIRWQASPKLLVRSSLGQGFKAPNLNDLYSAKYHGFPQFIDYVSCRENGEQVCKPRSWKRVGGGNKDLSAERSLSANLGFVVQPTRSFSLSLDSWYLQLKNQVGLDLSEMTMAEHKLGKRYIESLGIKVERNRHTKAIKQVTVLNQNLSETDLSGLDLATDFFTATRLGTITFRFRHSHLFYYRTVGFRGLDKKNIIGEWEHPQWKNALSVIYGPLNHHSAAITMRTIAQHKKQVKEKGYNRRHSEVDLQYTYKALWGGSLSLGLRNALGTSPPIDDSNPSRLQISESLYDGNGRAGWIQYKHIF